MSSPPFQFKPKTAVSGVNPRDGVPDWRFSHLPPDVFNAPCQLLGVQVHDRTIHGMDYDYAGSRGKMGEGQNSTRRP